ncbi:O-sialoglycoprotein endopeptidase [Terrisporobacter mayombei]|uniref:N(6)-L-threonylcarbamoyladenine synthase n=1 Tax=Terrisporobacter mayombei TaxID=1541 RepID=A0ABY9Q0W5_9FIRM|nr:O-sialoglycoprotein endopeptidase [Terrisporobacter mayombei]MCC3867280.1 O-sialoglycoprotein endopeptidase [Terrisporobacter mayombei]WMT81542.1 tRNA N6-adenosine threonylcarbamoyltransferase [Terrisporobacter mayombei]
MTHKNNNIILGFDTSCYTTSIAAISLNKEILLNERIILKVKKDNKGLRQSEAVFQHVNNMGELSQIINEKFKNYNIVGICASTKPRPVDNSYMPVFSVGYNFAKLLSSINSCTFYETTHQENHIEASLFNNNLENKDKFLAVHMSGGTTEILLVEKKDTNYNMEIVGGSLDVSFGQLVDRLGVRLNYNFPCGKYIDENALKCNEKIKNGLKTSVREGYMNLSGIENQINKIIHEYNEEYLSKILLDTLVRSMYKSLIYICDKYGLKEVLFGGGVSASEYIKKELSEKLKRKNIKAYFTDQEYATDNGVGCAIIGLNKMNNY